MNKHDVIDISKALYELDFICIDVDKKDTYIYKILNEMSVFLDKVSATEKELEEVKAMVKDIGDGGVSFDTSYQRMVFEALMNRVGRK